MERIINSESCKDLGQDTSEMKKLDNIRSRFILKNRFRSIAGDKRLGTLWVILDPIVMSLVYFLVFTVLRSKVSPESLFIGITLWSLVAVSVVSGLSSITDFTGGLKCERVRTRSLIKPMIQFRLIDSLSRSIGVAGILYLYYEITLEGVISLLVTSQIIGIFFEGISLNLSALQRRFADLRIIIGHFLRLMFFAGPVLYSMKSISGLHYLANEMNPFTYFVEYVRYLSDVENDFPNLDIRIFIGYSLVLLIFTIRGYSKIDDLRWELSTWS
jgi:ABC-type polysaccharide/polyol phosphate export permease